ncbi:hypothetical protein Q0590_35365 [Rhodocytophaga aerolata]|uniref:Transposase n=1 Tax=Rhodocytophaga aerolata TaxID=455078 RepID=A0ABT8RHM5_9BACT|nr:hypothetical protein [Rhodocytophaga aerolata]MDO1451606.1 hypothetical protein [Rhodocytophaga aerolata]
MNLFGILQRRFTIKDIYDYISHHWLKWFPHLPSYQVKVALQVADKGSNPMSSHRQVRSSTKNLYYHGLKLHFLGADCYQGLPKAHYIGFRQATANDSTVLKPMLSK